MKQSKHEPECTGLTARWCPRCGDCTCPVGDLGEQECPLHGPYSVHVVRLYHLWQLQERVTELERELAVERDQVKSLKHVFSQIIEARNFFRDELDAARTAMREAVRDFHCKSVLFSASFLHISGNDE